MESEEERLREELGRARSIASELQVFATESAMRAAAAEGDVAELEAQLLRLRLEAKQYREIIAKVGRSRSVRAATKIAGLARGRRGRPAWQDPDRLRNAVNRQVDRTVKATLTSSMPGPVLRVPTAETRRDLIRAGVASMPTRARGLLQVVEDLYDQVDEIYVYLNDYQELPPGLARDSRIRIFTGPDLGDRGKFRFVEGFRGYYFSVDDDIHYPAFYVEQLVDGIERYSRNAIVGLHGSILPEPFIDYYVTSQRRILNLYADLAEDTFVHILGSGCCAFHSDTISLSIEDFTQPNMADVFLAENAQRLKIPRVVLAHGGNWAEPLEVGGGSIYTHSRKGKDSRLNVKSETNRRIAAAAPWVLYTASAKIVRKRLRIAVAHVESVERPDIRPSVPSVAEMLNPFGADVRAFDLGHDLIDTVTEFTPQVVLIYGGDPDRADFAGCVELVDLCAASGSVVLVDLSVHMHERRSELIVEAMESWRSRHGDRIRLMVFAGDVVQAAGLEKIEDLVVVVPRPLEVETRQRASFHDSEGVLLSRYEALCDDSLLSEPVGLWLDAIRAALPEAPLFAFGDDGSELRRDLGVEILLSAESSVEEHMSKMRLMVSPLRYHPFETEPIEAAAVGLPVVYRRSEQSLSAYLGTGAVEVSSPADLSETLPLLYNDPIVWRASSRAGMRRAQSLDYRATRGELYSVLSRLVEED